MTWYVPCMYDYPLLPHLPPTPSNILHACSNMHPYSHTTSTVSLVSWYDLPSFLFHLFPLSFLAPPPFHLPLTPSNSVHCRWCSTLNHATYPSYPDTEPTKDEQDINQSQAFCIWLYSSQDMLLQSSKQMNPLFQKLNKPLTILLEG